MQLRTGLGYDIHRIAPDRRLVLGGVSIDASFGLEGHSDADVVLHAICDALLGAAAMGDIGELFPDTDAKYRGIDSRKLLAEVVGRVRHAGFRLENVDVTILAERPRLAAYKPAIRSSLADLLGLSHEAVGVKAGTNEGFDAVGRGLAIACLATALLTRDRSGEPDPAGLR